MLSPTSGASGDLASAPSAHHIEICFWIAVQNADCRWFFIGAILEFQLIKLEVLRNVINVDLK